MSFDLYVFDGDVPDDEAALNNLMDDESRWGTPLTPRLATFVAELERRYPGLDDDPDNSPWASWPLTQAMVGGTCCAFNIEWSQSERMSADIRALCTEQGLTLYDPQESLVVRPGTSSGTSARRRWWKRS